jgi:hypothetical protein
MPEKLLEKPITAVLNIDAPVKKDFLQVIANLGI